MLNYSDEQNTVFDWLLSGNGHGTLKAVAGSGKSFTLRHGINKVKVVKPNIRIAVCAFSSLIAKDFQDQMGFTLGVFIKTCHGFGFQAWQAANPNLSKKSPPDQESEKWKVIKATCAKTKVDLYCFQVARDLVKHAKNQLFKIKRDINVKDNWLEIIDKHNLTANFCEDDSIDLDIDQLVDHSIKLAKTMLDESIRLANTLIDFDDMIYMPLLKNCRMYTYDFVLIDEAQDTNPARRELAKRMLKPGTGRLLAVGDPCQAIFAFTGADSDSLDIIEREFQAITLPLYTSFRCSQAVIREAQKHVGHIVAHESNPEGSVTTITLDEFYALANTLTNSDVGLCRNTAPLVDICIRLLKMGIPCKIKGKDVMKSIETLLNRWSKPKTVKEYLTRLDSYSKIQIAKLMKSENELKAQALADQCDVIHILASTLAVDNPLDMLKSKLKSLFLDENGSEKPCFTLMTIHKSKGLEFNRVFWLGHNIYNPSPYARKDWQIEQETFLCYVAITRAKLDLVKVNMSK